MVFSNHGTRRTSVLLLAAVAILRNGDLLAQSALASPVPGAGNQAPAAGSVSSDARGDAVPATDSFHLGLVGDRLAFESVSDYEFVVNDPEPATRAALADRIRALGGFLSCADAFGTDCLIGDDWFASMLNADYVIQIGDTLFKVNPQEELVLTLPAVFESEYGDLVAERDGNPHIRRFSTDDDVLDLGTSGLQAGMGPASGAAGAHFSPATPPAGTGPVPPTSANCKKWKCTETAIGGSDKTTGSLDVDTAAGCKMEGEVHYNKFGIYFHLFAELDYTHNLSGAYTPTIDLEPVYYHVKCKNTVGPYNSYGNGAGNFHYVKYNSYEGSTGLNEVYFRARFKTVKVGTPSIFKQSDWIEIRKNY